MKYLINLKAAIMIIMAAYLLSTSCIYEAPGDRLYRTLWKSSEAPIKGLTMEFHCGNWVSARLSPDCLASFSHYEPHHYTATFEELVINLAGASIKIVEAHRQDDTLTIYWHLVQDETTQPLILHEGPYPDPEEQYSTRMHRLSAYE